jgi:hypothetical protein
MPMLGQARVQRTWRKQAMAMLVDRFERPYILLLHASFVVVATWLVVHAWLPSLSLSPQQTSAEIEERYLISWTHASITVAGIIPSFLFRPLTAFVAILHAQKNTLTSHACCIYHLLLFSSMCAPLEDI